MNGVHQKTMETLTKEQQLAKRRARVKQMIAEGRVMNDALRKKIKEEAKRQQQLQDAADLILVGMNPSRSKKSVTAVSAKPEAPVANVQLKSKVKVDSLAAKADAIIKELQGA